MKKKLGLPNITLLAASSVKVDLVQDALKISSYEIDFASIKLLSSSKPKIKFSEIEYVSIPGMDLDGYCKFFMYGSVKEEIPDYIRIFNKVGLAYGFLTDNAYIIDTKNGLEFFLSAVIYVNENQILNDDVYEFKEKGLPFFTELGNRIYEHELNRQRIIKPDFSHLYLTEN